MTFIRPKKYEIPKLIIKTTTEITEFILKLKAQLLFKIFGIIDMNNPNIIENVIV